MMKWVIKFILWLFAGPKVEKKEEIPLTNKMIYEVAVEIAKQTAVRSYQMVEVRTLEYNYNQVRSILSDPYNRVIYITPHISRDIRDSGMSIADYVELYVSYEIGFMMVPDLNICSSRIDEFSKRRVLTRRIDPIMDYAKHERNLSVYLERKAGENALRLLRDNLHGPLVDLVQKRIYEIDDELDRIVTRHTETASTL